MDKIAVLTSGGDSPGMNAAFRAVVRTGITKGLEVYGIEYGYEGLLDEKIRLLTWRDAGEILQTGGTVLKTARCPRFMDDEWVAKAAENLHKRGIEGLVVIGGDGSYRGAVELAKHGVKVVGVPATIDNDLGYTDFTIGFDTAVNTVLDAITKIRDTSSSHNRITIIEVMGRKCGDIALYAGLGGGAEIILVPECPMSMEEITEKVVERRASGRTHTIIVKAEGIEIPLHELETEIEKRTGHKVVSVILSYIQRGGSPTAQDRLLASRTAGRAVELLCEGKSSLAVGYRSGEIVAVDLKEAIEAPNVFPQDIYDLANCLS